MGAFRTAGYYILERPRTARLLEPKANVFRRSNGRPLRRLSSSALIQREAEAEALHSFEGRPISLSEESSGRRRHDRSLSSPTVLTPGADEIYVKLPKRIERSDSKTTRALEQYEVFRAIDRKDIDFLGDIRDKAFHLLLERQVGGQTPLLYAMRYGKPYEEVILFLVGAISQWINRLSDADFSKPVTLKLLKLARANLKFAIDEGLAKLQTGLIASFLQTLVMCEGDRWIRDQIVTISFALKAGPDPVEVAGSVVRRFCTTSLQNADLIADVEAWQMRQPFRDLLMMAAWSSALTYIEGRIIPLHYFARDDRIYNTFVKKLNEHGNAITKLPNRRLKRQMEAMRTELQGRTLLSRTLVDVLPQLKVEKLRGKLYEKGM